MEKQSAQMPASAHWLFMVMAIVFLCLISTGMRAQSNNPATKSGSSQTAADKEKEAKEQALRAVTGPASAFTPREVGDDELIEKRSEIEDSLRKSLLAFSKKGDFKELINSPWNEQTVTQFGKLVIPENKELGDFPSRLSVNKHQWACIMNLLAFVATTYRNQLVGKQAAEAFDKSLAWIARKDRGGVNYWFSCMFAIGMYGSSDLLTPTFWEGWDKGLNCNEAFRGLGNEKQPMKLKNEPATDELKAIGYLIRRANIPIPQHRYKADGTIPAGANSVKRNNTVGK